MTREIPSQSRETLEVPLIPLASTSLVVWRCLMRPSRFIHRHLLCLYGFGLGGAAIDICYGKTVCVPYHVAARKFLGTPRGRKTARHSISRRPLAVSLSELGGNLSRPRFGFSSNTRAR
jgi:hypothetical protein